MCLSSVRKVAANSYENELFNLTRDLWDDLAEFFQVDEGVRLFLDDELILAADQPGEYILAPRSLTTERLYRIQASAKW